MASLAPLKHRANLPVAAGLLLTTILLHGAFTPKQVQGLVLLKIRQKRIADLLERRNRLVKQAGAVIIPFMTTLLRGVSTLAQQRRGMFCRK